MTPFCLRPLLTAEKLRIREFTAFLSVTSAQNVVLFSWSMKSWTSTGNPLEIKLFPCCPNYNTLTCPGQCLRVASSSRGSVTFSSRSRPSRFAGHSRTISTVYSWVSSPEMVDKITAGPVVTSLRRPPAVPRRIQSRLLPQCRKCRRWYWRTRYPHRAAR